MSTTGLSAARDAELFGSDADDAGVDTQPSYASDSPEQPVPPLRKRLRTSRVLFNEVTADDNDRVNSSRHASTSASQSADTESSAPIPARGRGRGTRSRGAGRAGTTAERQSRCRGTGTVRSDASSDEPGELCKLYAKH